jgi:hypothetical protein
MGAVATEIVLQRHLVGHVLLSCVNTYYFYRGNALDSAVLLEASHPGATPSPLPGMRPLKGSLNTFVAAGAEGRIIERRIAGA